MNNNEYKTCDKCCYDILDDEGDVMEHECISNNELIAEFMGIVYPKLDNVIVIDNVVIKENELQYHTSWDWLMPVVEKIEGLGYWVNRNDGDVTISNISDIVVITPMSSGGIDMMYDAVVEFINEHNKYICGSCGDHANEVVFNEDTDVDECTNCIQ